MTLSTPIAFARAQCQTDSNGLTDANAIIFANEALNDFHRRLVDAGVDASQLQEAYRDGTVATSGNGSTFLYPTDMLFLKAIELNYASTNPGDYKTASQVDVSNLPNGSFSWLRLNADPNYPQFDDRGDWYEVFPAFTSGHNLTRAIRLIYYLQPTQYSSTSDTVAYPESKDQAILGWRMCANYLMSLRGNDNIAAANIFNAKYEERVRNYISTVSRGSQQPLQATPLQIDGFQF